MRREFCGMPPARLCPGRVYQRIRKKNGTKVRMGAICYILLFQRTGILC